jgi:hypothetical protein
MSCTEREKSLDRIGRKRLDPGEAKRLEEHLELCADCRRLQREEDVVRLALELSGPANLGRLPSADAILREAALRRAGRAEPPLAEVIPIALRWAPRFAAAAALAASIFITLLAFAPPPPLAPSELVAELLLPGGTPLSGDDLILSSLLSIGGGS